jgi:hypothetical protein
MHSVHGSMPTAQQRSVSRLESTRRCIPVLSHWHALRCRRVVGVPRLAQAVYCRHN